MNTEIKNLYNNDIVIRLAAILIVGSLNVLLIHYVKKYPTQYYGFFISHIITDVIILWLSFICVKTAYSQDAREFFIADIFYYSLLFALYVISDCVKTKNHCEYATMIRYNALFNLVAYAIFVIRTLSPFKDAKTGEFVNWPVIGPVGFYLKKRKHNLRYAPPSKKQAVMAYCLMLLAGGVGVALWLNDVEYVIVLQSAVITVTLIFGAIKTPAAIRAHQEERRIEREQVEAEKAQAQRIVQQAEEAAQQAHRTAQQAEEAAQQAQRTAQQAEEAAAQLAAANKLLEETVVETKKIVSHQMDTYATAQDEYAHERARLAAFEATNASMHGAANDSDLLKEIFNPANPHYSLRLCACIAIFRYFQGKDIVGQSAKDAIYDYAIKHAEEFGLMHKGKPSKNSAEQCAYVINWVNEAGAPQTQAKIGQLPNHPLLV